MTINLSVVKKTFSKKRSVLYCFLIACFVFVLTNSALISKSVYSSLLLCAKSIIPALFPMAVVCSFARKTGFINSVGRVCDKISHSVFKVSGEGMAAFIAGVVAGYPLGVDLTVKLYREGRIKKDEAERLLPFCGNAGTAFIISGVGQAMRGSTADGMAIFCAQLASAVTLGIILRFLAKSAPTPCREMSSVASVTIKTAFVKSVEEAFEAIMRACSFIIFFSVVCSSIDIILLRADVILSEKAAAILGGLFEIANGCVRAKEIESYLGVAITSAIVGWSGLSVIAQSAAIASDSDLSLKKFIIGKMAMALTSGVFGYLFAIAFTR